MDAGRPGHRPPGRARGPARPRGARRRRAGGALRGGSGAAPARGALRGLPRLHDRGPDRRGRPRAGAAPGRRRRRAHRRRAPEDGRRPGPALARGVELLDALGLLRTVLPEVADLQGLAHLAAEAPRGGRLGAHAGRAARLGLGRPRRQPRGAAPRCRQAAGAPVVEGRPDYLGTRRQGPRSSRRSRGDSPCRSGCARRSSSPWGTTAAAGRSPACRARSAWRWSRTRTGRSCGRSRSATARRAGTRRRSPAARRSSRRSSATPPRPVARRAARDHRGADHGADRARARPARRRDPAAGHRVGAGQPDRGPGADRGGGQAADGNSTGRVTGHEEKAAEDRGEEVDRRRLRRRRLLARRPGLAGAAGADALRRRFRLRGPALSSALDLHADVGRDAGGLRCGLRG